PISVKVSINRVSNPVRLREKSVRRFRFIASLSVDGSRFPVKEIFSTYNDRAFSNMGYVLDEGVSVKKASYKHKVKPASAEGPSSVRLDDAQGVVLNSLLSEAKKIKQSLGAVVGDLHKCTELLGKLLLM
ncbi:hypothetical protein HAX54_027809, partial [Datura stramonium]|nr:hypothetical protein [Datura stramonium]